MTRSTRAAAPRLVRQAVAPPVHAGQRPRTAAWPAGRAAETATTASTDRTHHGPGSRPTSRRAGGREAQPADDDDQADRPGRPAPDARPAAVGLGAGDLRRGEDVGRRPAGAAGRRGPGPTGTSTAASTRSRAAADEHREGGRSSRVPLVGCAHPAKSDSRSCHRRTSSALAEADDARERVVERSPVVHRPVERRPARPPRRARRAPTQASQAPRRPPRGARCAVSNSVGAGQRVGQPVAAHLGDDLGGGASTAGGRRPAARRSRRSPRAATAAASLDGGAGGHVRGLVAHHDLGADGARGRPSTSGLTKTCTGALRRRDPSTVAVTPATSA